MKIEKQIHESRLEIAKNLTVDQFIEITEAQVRAEQERDRFRKALEKEKETHKSVMKHWLDTNNKMLDKANDHYKGIEEENKKYKKALEEILNSSVSTWGFHEIAREALG